MILCKEAILENYESGQIVIEPFELQLVNPNSYDIRIAAPRDLATKLLRAKQSGNGFRRRLRRGAAT